MPDIYGRRGQPFGGAMSADSASLYFGAIDEVSNKLSWQVEKNTGLLAQQLTLNYSQPVNRIYELASNRVFYVAGRCRGEGSIGAVVGPQSLSKSFLKTYGDVCKAKTNTMYVGYTPACDSFVQGAWVRQDTNLPTYPGTPTQPVGGSEVMALVGVILTNVNYTVQAENMMFNQGLSFMFASLMV